VKKITLKEKLEFLQRERDQINRERIALVAENDALQRKINNQSATIKDLQEQLDKASNASRHWVLRKLGL
jgi:septal ring factor EnvC (AmiA/AmiB activator)